MQEYVQKSSRTTLPRSAAGVSAGELIQAVAPDSPSNPAPEAGAAAPALIIALPPAIWFLPAIMALPPAIMALPPAIWFLPAIIWFPDAIIIESFAAAG